MVCVIGRSGWSLWCAACVGGMHELVLFVFALGRPVEIAEDVRFVGGEMGEQRAARLR